MNVRKHLRDLLEALLKERWALEAETSETNPAQINYLRYPDLGVNVIMPGWLLDPAQNRELWDEAARGIARAVYKLTYPVMKRAVSVDVYQRPKKGWAEQFYCEVLIPPGANLNRKGSILYTRDFSKVPQNDRRRIP